MKRIFILGFVFAMGAACAQAATFTVSSSADAGSNTLRQCILDANSSAPPNEIVFTLGSPYTISLSSALPVISNTVDINALTGYPNPTILLDGAAVGGSVNGLEIDQVNGCTIQGLRLAHFSNFGIYLDRADSNVIQRCAVYSNQAGVVVEGGSFNRIGGSASDQKNTLSANTTDGISIYGGGISNQISGNFIGTDEAGTNAWPNGNIGVRLIGGRATLVGGANASPGELFPGNLISGNGQHGVQIQSSDGNSKVQGNLIGTERWGHSALPNGQSGVFCQDSPSNVIGGADATLRNTISGNGDHGIYLSGTQTCGNILIGNYVGTDILGTDAIPNGQDGVRILDAPDNRVGGGGTEMNLLSGNAGCGLLIWGFSGWYGATGTVVQGNFIGTDSSGLLPLANRGKAGLEIECAGTWVGGTNAGNVIGGNLGYGIYVGGEGHNTVIRGNWIGPYDASLSALSNSWDGIYFYKVGEGVIGGTNLWDRNIISGNGRNGIYMYGSNCVQTTIAGNFIGLDASGSVDMGNGHNGIRIYQGQSNQIGVAVSGGQNLISGNAQSGISIQSRANTVQNNIIGPDLTGVVAVGNDGSGVDLYNSQGCRIGGYDSMEGNLISGNGEEGVLIDGATSTSNELLGNWIGCDINRTNALGNGTYGVRFRGGAYSNLVGGGESDGNEISFNGLDGLYVGSSSHGIAIVGNGFAFNGELGIDLDPGGVTVNDALDADSGANGLQNFPILTTLTNNGTHVIVSGYLESEASKEYRVEFFFNRSCDPSGYGEGEYVIALVSNRMTDGAGFAVFTNLAIELHGSPPDFLTATATDLELWNTSEFSPFLLLDSDSDGMGDGYEDEYFGGYQSGNPTGDLDSDGARNREEFDADTDPSDADSLFEIVGMSNLPTETLVGLESSGSRQYQVQRREAMDDTLTWLDFDSWQDGSGGVLIFTDSIINTTQFYRAQARIPEIP